MSVKRPPTKTFWMVVVNLLYIFKDINVYQIP